MVYGAQASMQVDLQNHQAAAAAAFANSSSSRSSSSNNTIGEQQQQQNWNHQQHLAAAAALAAAVPCVDLLDDDLDPGQQQLACANSHQLGSYGCQQSFGPQQGM